MLPPRPTRARERDGAVRLEATEDVRVEGSLFVRLDSNAISINGYNRRATVERNESVRLALARRLPSVTHRGEDRLSKTSQRDFLWPARPDRV